MATLFFTCPSCGNTFGVPREKIPAEGGRGRCMQCRNALTIYPDGRVTFAPGVPMPKAGAAGAPASAPPPPPARPAQAEPAWSLPQAPPPPPPKPEPALSDEPIWEVRSMDSSVELPLGRITLGQLRELILIEKVRETDLVRVLGGDWGAASSFPAVTAFFAEYILAIKEKHGDEDHCAHHPDRAPGFKCHRCQDYLCQECVLNEPLVAGGADHWVCATCRAETTTLKRKGGLKGLFRKG